MSTLNATNLKNPSSGSNNIVLNTDGTTTIAAPSNIIKSGTAVASTSGTSIDFTGIPSWVKRVTVMFSGVSTSGTALFRVQLGAGSVQTSSYVSRNTSGTTGWNSVVTSTGGFDFQTASAASTTDGHLVLSTISANAWVASGLFTNSFPSIVWTGGNVTLSATLDRVRITTVNGTDTFDAGTINILWEG